MENGRRSGRTGDEFNERRVFGVDAKIVKAEIGSASGNVISLVEGETVECGGPHRTRNATRDDEQNQANEVALRNVLTHWRKSWQGGRFGQRHFRDGATTQLETLRLLNLVTATTKTFPVNASDLSEVRFTET